MSKKNVRLRPFYRRKLFLWPAGILLFILLVLFAFRVSPWPGALVIRAVFSNDSKKQLAALEKHTPSIPITTIANQSYRADDKDALLDVHYPQAATQNLPVIIWTHGGAWLSGSKDNDAPYFKLLAEKGFAVVALNYTLAPEARYPKAVFQINDAYGYLREHADRLKLDMSRVVLAGDSAGANLSAQMAALVTNPAYAKEMDMTPKLPASSLSGVILNCGIYKMEGLTQPDPTLPKIIGWGDDISVWAYSGTRDFTDDTIRQMSPYYYATGHFPPTFITGGNNDPLTDAQSRPFAEKLTALGVPVTELFYTKNHQPGLPHEYQFNLDTADGQNALKEIVAFAKERTTR